MGEPTGVGDSRLQSPNLRTLPALFSSSGSHSTDLSQSLVSHLPAVTWTVSQQAPSSRSSQGYAGPLVRSPAAKRAGERSLRSTQPGGLSREHWLRTRINLPGEKCNAAFTRNRPTMRSMSWKFLTRRLCELQRPQPGRWETSELTSAVEQVSKPNLCPWLFIMCPRTLPADSSAVFMGTGLHSEVDLSSCSCRTGPGTWDPSLLKTPANKNG